MYSEINGSAKVVNDRRYGKGPNFPTQGAQEVAQDSPSLDIVDAITLAGWSNYPPNNNWECIVNKWAWNFNGFKAELTGPAIIKDNTWHHNVL